VEANWQNRSVATLRIAPFPSQILIGACGCSPQISEETTGVCECPDGLSFDTAWGCVGRTAFLDSQRAGGMVFNDYTTAAQVHRIFLTRA
jgi:hypothetical protein